MRKKFIGNKYDYSKVEYVNNRTKVCIICSEHGEFWQTPNSHLKGCGCSNCRKKIMSNKLSYTSEIFIQKAREVHGNKYDYSKVEYKDFYTKVCIICPIHGEFWQKPNIHIRTKICCPKCNSELKKNNKLFNSEIFIQKAREVHGDKYDYSKVEYTGAVNKVCIICPIHGEFWQTPAMHNLGQGCPKCAKNFKLNTNSFIKKAIEVHGDKYNYSKVNYVGNKIKVCIICPIHGEFWQKPNDHLNGIGCPLCSESHLEKEINDFLIKYNINFERQKRFDWLGKQSLDFYLPEYNIAIECQGRQHFISDNFFKNIEEIIERDKRKKKLCNDNNIFILYYSNLGINYPYNVLENKNEILKYINYEFK